MGLHTKHWFMPVRKSSAFKQQTRLWNGHVVAFHHVHTYTFLSHLRFTLKETNGFAPRNGWRWNTTLILGRPIFSGELLVLRKGTILKRRETQPENQPVPVKIALDFSGILRVPFGQHHFLMWFFHKTERFWLVVSTHLKNISQIKSFPQVGVKTKTKWNNQPEFFACLLI